LWINYGFAQTNALIVRIDTMTVKFGTRDTLVPIFYRVEGTKPADFRGYDSRFSFDTAKLGDSALAPWLYDSSGKLSAPAYDTHLDSVLFWHTATWTSVRVGISLIIGATLPGEERALAEGGTDEGVNRSDSLLYRGYLSMHSVFADTAFLHLFRFDQTAGQPFDTVILQDGWIKYQKEAITVTTSGVTGVSDSLIRVPVQISDMSQANIRTGVFSFDLDTSILQFVGSIAGNIPGNSLVTSDSVKGTHVWVTISNQGSTNPMTGSGKIATLLFKAQHRTDTLCTMLGDSLFQALNTDALVSTVKLSLGDICVKGQSLQSVDGTRLQSESLNVWPNPFNSLLNISMGASSEGMSEVQVTDVLGRTVVSGQMASGIFRWYVGQEQTPGVYFIRVIPMRNPTENAPMAFSREVILIH
jgi:hypothetical protein